MAKEANEGYGCAAMILAIVIGLIAFSSVPTIVQYYFSAPRPCVEQGK